jgi:hypothetical protein
MSEAAEVISQPGGAGTERSDPGPAQSADRRAPNFEPSEDEKTVVGEWLKRVTRAEDDEGRKKWAEELPTWRGYVDGTKHDDKSGTKLVRTNMVFATIAAQIPELYARNPVIAVTPTESVAPDQMGLVKKFCTTAERVIDKLLTEEGKLKKRAKANIRSTSTTAYGVLKVLFQKEYRGDPIAVRRIEDTQDNLARIEALAKQLKKTDDVRELALKRDELRSNLKALAYSNEVKIFKGFTIDRLKSEDFIILDDNVGEFDEYEDAGALAHRIWITVGDFQTLFRMEPHAATRYGQPRSDANATSTDKTPQNDQFVCVIEIWDKKAGVVRTTAKGMNRWCREPYAPPCTPQRWYPFYVLAFNQIEGRWRPLSDVELLMGLQDEYNTTRTNYADVREKAVPITFFRKGGGLTQEDIEAFVNRGNKDTIGVEGNPAVPLTQDIMRLDGPKIDPQAYDVTMIRNDMDIVVGRSDASRANLIKPKTATEAEIMQEAMQSRVGERRDTHEDLLSEMGEAALEIALRDLTKAEVQQIAGADAQWPENPQSVEEIFRQVSVRVKAGSSGKPNQQKIREQWTQLMPVVSETMKSVSELRASGNFELANSQVGLLRETLSRFEESLDVDSLIPPIEEAEQGQLAQLQQQTQQLQQELLQTQEELQKCQDALVKAQAGEQVQMKKLEYDQQRAQVEDERTMQSQAQEEARALAEEEAKAQRDHELAMEKERTRQAELAAEDARHERELEHKERLASLDREVADADRSADREHQTEVEKIKRGLPESPDPITKAVEVLVAKIDELVESNMKLAQEVEDNTNAKRVPEYGDDGMPTGVRLEKRPRSAAQPKAH